MFPFKMSSRAAARFNCKRVQPDDLRLFRYGVVPDTARYKSSVTVPNVTRNVTFRSKKREYIGRARSSAFPLFRFFVFSIFLPPPYIYFRFTTSRRECRSAIILLLLFNRWKTNVYNRNDL